MDDSPNRLRQAVLIASTLLGSWLAMQAVHEAGHVLAALSTGGRIERVVLHPLVISRTDLAENPRPLVTVWAGPIVGIALPLLAWFAGRAMRWSGAFLLRFFAGFCLVANGLYIGVGSFWSIGDAGEMLRHGSPAWTLWLFGAAAASIGVWLWHGQGAHFGLGPDPRPVSRSAAWGTLAACAALILLGLAVGGA